MTEISERPFEERQVELMDWFQKIGKIGWHKEIPNADRQLVKEILVELGAKMEPLQEVFESLTEYKNSGKKPGLYVVWGEERVEAYKLWVVKDFMPLYEQKIGREFPTMWSKKTKTYDDVKYSGAMQFLGELTAFGMGAKSDSRYAELTQDRIKKGKRFENLKPGKTWEHSPHSFFPPEFPQAALKYLAYHKSD